ncbi:hypothetical protein COCON_G00092780 [Conger conger]|uniref:Integrase catalytic domain-containing protein n=1 Tax=Conger conger TaxID=82655 RepID=A0A9Q1DLL0_CONCO|nr:hypothetical protein COCON_G00092780 [Conger conger]
MDETYEGLDGIDDDILVFGRTKQEHDQCLREAEELGGWRRNLCQLLWAVVSAYLSSGDFRHFAETWGFTHTTLSPNYPQSNGLAERTVQTAKHILDKARAENRDPYLSLLEYRNTPVDNLTSPAQLLMSRRLHPILPATAKQLQSQVTCQQTAHQRREVIAGFNEVMVKIAVSSTFTWRHGWHLGD